MNIIAFISFLIGGIVAVNCFRQQKHPGHHKHPSVVTSSHAAPVPAPYNAVPSYIGPEFYSGVVSHYGAHGVEEEKLSLDELYNLALEEGGGLIVYVGGYSPAQQNGNKAAFEARFPGLNVQVIVDLERNHHARLDNQIERGNIIPDVLQLQNTPDFERWKSEGVLMPYKPLGWKHVYPDFKDPEGYSTGLYVLAFSNNINREMFGNNEEFWPTEANDYLIPELKGKIVSSYPNDDDATLYLFKLIIEKYGWKWLTNFIANQPTFVRGGRLVLNLLGNSTSGASFTATGALRGINPVQFVLPKSDPFVSWAARGAILKATKRPATAKLYMSWFLDLQTQSNTLMWSVRKDVPAPPGFRSIFDYPGQTDPIGYDKFAEDRAAVEKFRGQVTLYVGEVEEPLPPGDLGLDPATMSVAALAGLTVA